MSKDKSPGAIQTHYSRLLEKGLVIDDTLTVDAFLPSPCHILVEPIPPDAVTKSGIVIPDKAQEKKSAAFVISVSPKDEEGRYVVGDVVLFADSTGYDLQIQGRNLKILQYSADGESEILGHWPKEIFDKSK